MCWKNKYHNLMNGPRAISENLEIFYRLDKIHCNSGWIDWSNGQGVQRHQYAQPDELSFVSTCNFFGQNNLE